MQGEESQNASQKVALLEAVSPCEFSEAHGRPPPPHRMLIFDTRQQMRWAILVSMQDRQTDTEHPSTSQRNSRGHNKKLTTE